MMATVYHLLFSLTLLHSFASAEEPLMLPNDGRVVYGKLGSKFNYRTILPGEYTRVDSGMHSIIVKGEDCSTPLFTCTLEKDMPYRSVAVLSGVMTYGLKRVTFLGNHSIPIVILFYTDHYWPEIDDHTFQWQYSLPLVTSAKDTDIVTFSVFILHFSPVSLPNFTLSYSASNDPVYKEKEYDYLKDYPHILELQRNVFFMHTIIRVTVKKKEEVDYYCIGYNGQYHTHAIVWAKPDVISDILSLLPMEEVIGHFFGSATQSSFLGSFVLIDLDALGSYLWGTHILPFKPKCKNSNKSIAHFKNLILVYT
ncbi:hypothetical transcript [Echinococcus multilocularis]|uniref:Hypothetical transcript n=1 Tax=Echinococcus multilocularis TaxID=6211 RepID=A0A0S4MKT4_ECHMU|nr:hypothetical transcript [Echinococcus multilocularis]